MYGSAIGLIDGCRFSTDGAFNFEDGADFIRDSALFCGMVS